MTVKDMVKELYQQAGQFGLGNLTIYLNELGTKTVADYKWKEGCPGDSIPSFYNGTVLAASDLCNELSGAQQSFIMSLGLELKPSCFYWSRDPSVGYSGWEGCHIRFGGRELTQGELWLNEFRQLAIDMGYDIRSCAGYPGGWIGWGFFSTDKTTCMQKFLEFYNKTGIGGSSTRITIAGGYIQAYTTIYLNNMYKVTEPYVPPECEEGTHEVLEMCPDGVTEQHWRDCVGGQWVPGSAICQITPPVCEEGDTEILEYCAAPYADVPKRWQVCVGGEWQQLAQDCPVQPPPEEMRSLMPLMVFGTGIIVAIGYMYFLER